MLWIWGPLAKSSKFKPTPKTLRNHKKSPTGLQKSPKICLKVTRKTPKFTEQLKTWNLMKTTVFTMFSAHPGTGCGCDFQPRITKKTTLEPMLQFSANKSEKTQNLVQTGSQEDPRIHQQIIKIHIWTPRCPARCPPGPQDHQNGVPGIQNGALRSPKLEFYV